MKNYKIDSYSLRSLLNYESNNYDCECDSICRCSVIDVIGISPSIDSFVVISELGETPLDKALFFMYAKSLITIDDIEFDIVNGYYGQELEVSGFSKLGKYELEYFDKLSSLDKLESCLNAENGKFKTTILKNIKQISFDKVDRKYIDTPINNKLHKDTLDEYKSFFQYSREDLPVICVLKKIADRYQIIDGRHRFSVFTDKFPKKLIPAIVVE